MIGVTTVYAKAKTCRLSKPQYVVRSQFIKFKIFKASQDARREPVESADQYGDHSGSHWLLTIAITRLVNRLVFKRMLFRTVVHNLLAVVVS